MIHTTDAVHIIWHLRGYASGNEFLKITDSKNLVHLPAYIWKMVMKCNWPSLNTEPWWLLLSHNLANYCNSNSSRTESVCNADLKSRDPTWHLAIPAKSSSRSHSWINNWSPAALVKGNQGSCRSGWNVEERPRSDQPGSVTGEGNIFLALRNYVWRYSSCQVLVRTLVEFKWLPCYSSHGSGRRVIIRELQVTCWKILFSLHPRTDYLLCVTATQSWCIPGAWLTETATWLITLSERGKV